VGSNRAPCATCGQQDEGHLASTVEELRIEIAKALVRAGGDDAGDLFEWHACVDQPACRATKTPPEPCACAGYPYLSDAAWSELQPIIQRAQRGQAL
jgi:hypothetical protein